jgi:hypothetical protein
MAGKKGATRIDERQKATFRKLFEQGQNPKDIAKAFGVSWRTVYNAVGKVRDDDFDSEFNKRVQRGPGCWQWVGAKTAQGYGQFMYNRKRQYAHRIALILRDGEDRPGLNACHHCDNPLCVRPDHLFWGTANDNIKDMVSKGRGWWQKRHELAKELRGDAQ